jgi:hypothetical protein
MEEGWASFWAMCLATTLLSLKRVHGLEPRIKVWKTLVLPLHHTRSDFSVWAPNWLCLRSIDSYIISEPGLLVNQVFGLYHGTLNQFGRVWPRRLWTALSPLYKHLLTRELVERKDHHPTQGDKCQSIYPPY